MSNVTVKNDHQDSISYKMTEGKLTRVEEVAAKPILEEDVALRLNNDHSYKVLRKLYRRQVKIGILVTIATLFAAGFIVMTPAFSSAADLIARFFSQVVLSAASDREETARLASFFGNVIVFILTMGVITIAVVIPLRRYGGFLKKVERRLHKFFVSGEEVLHQYLSDVIENDTSIKELLNGRHIDKQLSNFQYLTNQESNELTERQLLMKGDITDGSTRLASVAIKLELGEDYKELRVIKYDLVSA